MVLGVLMNIAMTVAFGWPYTVAWFLALLSYNYPVLWDWSERTLLSLLSVVIFIQLMWIGWIRRRRVY
jgi:hypothetical protein